nr:MAG TPA: Glutathione-dependent formaldehyde-activating enzyme [Caudoviricetes sp.]DAL68763.1 MAG TPA: Glutathione-dependent formaldehyde-activating enzyme [Caudoviricetes sp.]
MSFCSDNSKAAGFRVCRFSFCTNCGTISMSSKS